MANELIDTTKQEKQEKKSKRKRDRELSDIRTILLTAEGRRFYWRLMSAGEIFQNAFCDDNARRTDYKLGRQAISRDFFNDLLEAKPQAYAQMQQERESEAESERRQEELEQQQTGILG